MKTAAGTLSKGTYKDIEEEKKRFDTDIENIERKVSSKLDT
jgi:hypothetical protein